MIRFNRKCKTSIFCITEIHSQVQYGFRRVGDKWVRRKGILALELEVSEQVLN